jgi:hypothetical protein
MSLSLCPCPRCFHRHEGSLCGNPCAFCNLHHEGPCVGRFSTKCLLCGESHQPWVKCPCPRCFHRHDGADCPSVEEWAFHSCNGTLDKLIGNRCKLCGQHHSDNLECPCPQCQSWHVGSDCLPFLFSAGFPADQPCHRCQVWHGADVCHRNLVLSSEYQVPRMPEAVMLNRAVANTANVAVSIAVAPAHSDAASDRHDIGPMSILCSHCGARFWRGESIQCCYDGSLIIPEPSIPQSLSDIILSPAVRCHLRSYNMAMAMASVGHSKSGFPDGVFTLSGRSYHRIGPLLPMTGHAPNFAQIYTVDTAMATDRRSEIFENRLDRSLLSALHNQLSIHNRYVSEFCRVAASDVHELVWTTEDNIMGMQMGSLLGSAGCKRPIVIKRYGDSNTLQFIDDGHALYHPLAYPLLFPTGSPGWYWGMSRSSEDGSSRRMVSLHDYGRYILMHRERLVRDYMFAFK